MNSFFDNAGPSYHHPSPETPADGTYESFLDLFIAPYKGDRQFVAGQCPQSDIWDTFFPQPQLPNSNSFQPEDILSANYEPYMVDRSAYEPNAGIANYGTEYEGAMWAGYGSVSDTVYPPHTLHTQWHPETDSVDDPPNRQTEISSSVLRTDQNFSISQRSFLPPSPPLDGSFITNVLPDPISASPSSSPVPSLGTNAIFFHHSSPETIAATIAATGSIRRKATDPPGPSHCLLPGCRSKTSNAPFLTTRHKMTGKHREQLSPAERVELELWMPFECAFCDYRQCRPHTLIRHMGSRTCRLRHLELKRGRANRKSGRPRGGAKRGKKGGHPMVITTFC